MHQCIVAASEPISHFGRLKSKGLLLIKRVKYKTMIWYWKIKKSYTTLTTFNIECIHSFIHCTFVFYSSFIFFFAIEYYTPKSVINLIVTLTATFTCHNPFVNLNFFLMSSVLFLFTSFYLFSKTFTQPHLLLHFLIFLFHLTLLVFIFVCNFLFVNAILDCE